MKNSSVIKSHATGFGMRSVRAMLFGAAALVPVISMGITIPSALSVRGAQKTFEDQSMRLSQRGDLMGRLGDYTERGSLDELAELASVLRGMVPFDVKPLEEFALIRAIAARGEVDVSSIRPVRTHAALSLAFSNQGGVEAEGDDAASGIVIDEVIVTFNGGIDFGLQLVSTLRESGYPTIVFGFDLARTQAGQKNYAVELRLGFLRRVST